MRTRRGGFRIMAGLIGLLRPLSPHMLLAILMGVLGHLCAIAIPVGGAWALYLVWAGEGAAARRLFPWIAAAGLLRGALHYGEQNRNHYIAFTLLKIIRDHVFGALRRLAPAKMDSRNKGELISTVTSDIELLEVFYAHTISPIAIAVLVSLCMLGFFGWLHPWMVPLALGAYVSVGALLPLFAGGRMKEEGVQVREGAGNLSAFLMDSLRGVREILRYGQGGNRLEALDARSREIGEAQGQLARKNGFYGGMTEMVILLFDLGMLLLCVYLYQRGEIGLREALLAQVGLMSSFGPVAALSALAGSLTNTLAAGERVLSLLEEQPETADILEGAEVSFREMEMREVDFAYPEGSKVLRDFSLEIPEKGIIGITGCSGTGKSTALKLLMRFYDPQAGRVTLSGRDLRQVKTASLRRNQAYVTQETQLFNDSIENNIRIGRMDATRAEVEAAAKMASIHDFIQTLPRGYDTGIGEMGEMLSSGERQRIALARAFLSQAPLILLDEPTSNLDTLNEGRILKSLDEVRKEKSIVLVSHRPAVKAVADRSFMVQEG
ncbi:MAG: ABC transporter ATP-binding protein [Clostridia bacterium]|nr:ABC transporter ATP-binding protein [Clostridia bacterium]